MVQIVIYVIVFLIAGYLSYRFVISHEVKNLQSAQTEYKKEKVILKALEEKAQSINALANNAQKLEAELISIRSRVFNEDNDVLGFMRSLPVTTNMTGNNLMSIVPLDVKSILEPPPPSSTGSDKAKNTVAQNAPASLQTLPCKLKPIEVSFLGGYGDVIHFFDELKKLGQYMTINNISLLGGYDAGQVNVKVVLNLLQMGVDVGTPSPQVAAITQRVASIELAKQAAQAATAHTAAVESSMQEGNIVTPQVATAIKRPMPTAIGIKPIQTVTVAPSTQTAKSAIAVKPAQKVTPVQTAKQPQVTVKPTQTVAVAPSMQTAKSAVSAVKPVQKVTPVQTTKQPQVAVKPTQTVAVAPPTQTAKSTVSAVKPVQKVTPVQTTKQPQVAVKPTQTVAATEPTQTAKQKSSNAIQYAVRVGKFSYYENAENLAKTLKSHQYNAWIKPYSYKGKTTYWVYVGSFETKDKAENFAESMQQKLSYIDDYVIMDVKAGIRRNS